MDGNVTARVVDMCPEIAQIPRVKGPGSGRNKTNKAHFGRFTSPRTVMTTHSRRDGVRTRDRVHGQRTGVGGKLALCETQIVGNVDDAAPHRLGGADMR